MLFLVALAYKNKEDIVERVQEEGRLKLLTEKQDFAQKMAVVSAQQDERNRISADMHDELGSGATAIRLASEVLKQKMKGTTFPELERISRNADELINKMNALIWTMKSENDTLESLALYIRIYALEFFDNTDIDCRVNIPASFAATEITGGRRRNVFLCVKESLHNVLKHSRAKNVVISFSVDQQVVITIADDGMGIDFKNLRPFSSGLTGMSKRMRSIEGSFRIENIADRGVLTTIKLGLGGSRYPG